MDTPQGLIYKAWINTAKPIAYEVSDAKGCTQRKEVDFAIPEKNKYYDSSYRGLCNMCGQCTHGGIPIKRIFSSNYMDWQMHKEPEATHICKSCAFCIGMNPIGRIALFRYPIVAGKTLNLCNRRQFRDYLINPPEPPFVMIFPTSQKKHLFGKSKISYSKEQYFCNFEEITIGIDFGIRKLINDIESLRGFGFTKSDIERCRIPGNIIKKYTFDCYDYENLLKIMGNARKSAMFSLALEVSQKMKEDDAICYLDLTLKMK